MFSNGRSNSVFIFISDNIHFLYIIRYKTYIVKRAFFITFLQYIPPLLIPGWESADPILSKLYLNIHS